MENGNESKARQMAKPSKKAPFYTTKMFFQRVISVREKFAWVLFANIIYGSAAGYFFTVQASMQAAGASNKQQALLTVALYPYLFKFLIAPFLDRFYSYKFGKSKTYILIGSIFNSSFFVFLSFHVETYLKTKDAVMLTTILFLSSVMEVIIENASDCWILTLFDEESRSKVSAYQNIGNAIGVTLAFNLFYPLNDVEWLNEIIFTNNPRDSPLLTHSELCFAIGCVYLAQFLYMLLFVSEEVFINPGDTVTFTQVLKVFPRHFTNKNMLKLVLYMFACRFFYYMISSLFDLMMMANGHANLRRTYISNLDLVLCPIGFFLSYLTTYYLKPGHLMKFFHLTTVIMVAHSFFRYLTLMDLITNGNRTRALVARGFSTFLNAMDYSIYFLVAFFYNITNPKIGTTGMSCLTSLAYQSWLFPPTVGFYLADYIPYQYLIPACLVIETLILVCLFRFSLKLDRMDPHEFDISYALGSEENKSPSENKVVNDQNENPNQNDGNSSFIF